MSGRETFEEYENRVNEFMATHDVTPTIMVVYQEKG